MKTGCYYIRSRPKVQAQQFTIEPEKKSNNNDKQLDNNFDELDNILANFDLEQMGKNKYCDRSDPMCESCSG